MNTPAHLAIRQAGLDAAATMPEMAAGMITNQMAWSFGGELWDPTTYQIEGVMNSPENVAALEFDGVRVGDAPPRSAHITCSDREQRLTCAAPHPSPALTGQAPARA